MSSSQKPWKRSFFTITAGQTVSMIGSSAVQFALIWWLASESGSALTMSLAGLFAFLPRLLLGPFVGVWIDRLKRKHVVICADMFMGVVAAVFAVCFLLGQPPYWAAYLVLGMRAVGEVFHGPALLAAIPMIVPSDQLVRANGWGQFLQSGAFMLGPVLGAAMYAALPLPLILLTDLIGAAVASGTMAVVKVPEIKHETAQAPHFLGELKAGAAILLKDKRLCILALASTASMVFFLPLSSLYPLMTSSHFGATSWHASIVELAFALGMMVCAGIVGAYGSIKHKFRLIHLSFFILGAATLFCGILPTAMVFFWVFVFLCALMGASSNLYGIPMMAYLQETLPHEAQGRALSLYSSLMSLAMPVGLVLAGPLAERFGVDFWFLVSGIALLIITSVSAILLSRTPQSTASA